MVKIFLANLPDEGFVMNGDERYFLEAYGTVKECEKIKYGLVLHIPWIIS